MTLPDKGLNRPDPMAFGRGLKAGLGVNLLVQDVATALAFQTEVLRTRVLYWEDHFAILAVAGNQFMLHSDWSYRDHELRGAVDRVTARGSGLELRLYGLDPDQCVERARAADAIVLAAAMDKPHGLREAYIVDPDGYVWVPSRALP